MLAKGRSQEGMMTVGRALARGKLAAARRRAKYARQVWAVFHGPPCHHVRLTSMVLALALVSNLFITMLQNKSTPAYLHFLLARYSF